MEEFLAFDSKGQEVILRRNVSHPGEPVAAPAVKSNVFSIKPPSQDQSKSVSGVGFFADFHAVRNRLQAKGLLKK